MVSLSTVGRPTLVASPVDGLWTIWRTRHRSDRYKVVGDNALKMVSTYVVDKGKPLSSPAK